MTNDELANNIPGRAPSIQRTLQINGLNGRTGQQANRKHMIRLKL